MEREVHFHATFEDDQPRWDWDVTIRVFIAHAQPHLPNLRQPSLIPSVPLARLDVHLHVDVGQIVRSRQCGRESRTSMRRRTFSSLVGRGREASVISFQKNEEPRSRERVFLI
jgi:hypothetical protein